MKKMKIFYIALAAAATLQSCEDNEVMPDYDKKGSATTTVATIAASDTKPLKGTNITITLEYVNPASDPLKTIELKAKVGSGTYETVQTFDAQSGAKDAQVTREVTYTTPNVSGTITFDMVITSQLPYPQVKRTSVTVQ